MSKRKQTIFRRVFRLLKLTRRFERENAHNDLHPKSIFPEGIVSAGIGSYGYPVIVAATKENRLIIGNYVSIAKDVTFVLNSDHPLDRISTFPFKVEVLGECESEAVSKGDIVVDDDVWLGCGAIVLSGVHIGQGAVVAAGAVVTKDVPPYAIVGGVPAKVIRYRFNEELIRELKKVDYSRLTKEMILEHEADLYRELKDISQLAWMPKKTDPEG